MGKCNQNVEDIDNYKVDNDETALARGKIIYNALTINLGLNKEQAIGCMASMYGESRDWNPEAVEKGQGQGEGICQWTYPSRKSFVKNSYFKQTGVALDNKKGEIARIPLKNQVQCMIEEINRNYKSLHVALLGATNAEDAVDKWTRIYENPSNPDERVAQRKGFIAISRQAAEYELKTT